MINGHYWRKEAPSAGCRVRQRRGQLERQVEKLTKLYPKELSSKVVLINQSLIRIIANWVDFPWHYKTLRSIVIKFTLKKQKKIERQRKVKNHLKKPRQETDNKEKASHGLSLDPTWPTWLASDCLDVNLIATSATSQQYGKVFKQKK